MAKGALTGLKSLKKVLETANSKGSQGSSFLKLKDGQAVTVRFLQEIDESGKHYDEGRGLAITVFEHVNPDDLSMRFLCTMEEEGRCVGCERVVVNPRWKRRSRLFVNAYVVEDDAVQVVATGFSAKGIGGTLIEYAEDFGTICDRNYKLKRVGERLSTSYTLTPREVSPFDFDSKQTIDLEQFARYRSYEECLALVEGTGDRDW